MGPAPPVSQTILVDTHHLGALRCGLGASATATPVPLGSPEPAGERLFDLSGDRLHMESVIGSTISSDGWRAARCRSTSRSGRTVV
jgi:hypothetical protein